jgi:hypothetical protein
MIDDERKKPDIMAKIIDTNMRIIKHINGI